MPNVMAALPNTGGALCSTPQFGCAVRMSRESKILKISRSDWLDSGNVLIQHLSEKCNFYVSPFCQVVQKHKLFEVA